MFLIRLVLIVCFACPCTLQGAAADQCIKSMTNAICTAASCKPPSSDKKRDQLELDLLIRFLKSKPSPRHRIDSRTKPLFLSRSMLDEPQFFENSYADRTKRELSYTKKYFEASPTDLLSATTTLRGSDAILQFSRSVHKLFLEINRTKELGDDSVPVTSTLRSGRFSHYWKTGCVGIACATALGIMTNVFQNKTVFGNEELTIAAAAFATSGWMALINRERHTEPAPLVFLRNLPTGNHKSAFFSMPLSVNVEGSIRRYTIEMMYYTNPVLGGHMPTLIISSRPFDDWQ